MKQLALGTLLAFGLVLPAHAQQADWNLDPNHTHIGFTARHLGFAKVRGEFSKFSASVVKADAKTGKLSALEAEVEAASVDTGNAKRDDHLRSGDFFDAKQHPKLKLKLKSIKWKGNSFVATVALTMRGTTKDVKFEGELLGVRSVNFGKGAHQRAAYEARATVNRKEFGLSFNGLAEGISIVGDNVELVLEAEFAMTPTK